MKKTKLGSSWAAIRPLIEMLFLGLMVCGTVEAQSVIVKPTKAKPTKTTVHRTAPKPKPTVRRHVRTNSTPQRQVDQPQRNVSGGNGGVLDPIRHSDTYTPDVQTITANGVRFKMVEVRGGTFRMGATSEQGSDAESDEKSVHGVTLSGYYISQTEVTQALWEAVTGSNPSYFKGAQKPVEQVSWIDCQDFLSKLNSLTGKHFRLPTEAEWEFAARGGNNSRGYKYSGGGYPDDVAWYTGSSGIETHDVGTKSANELGLYDMSGNVWEWCSDWKGDYDSGSQTNPRGAESGSYRVDRGGSWGLGAKYCRVSARGSITPGSRSNCIGLRLALSTL